MAVYRHDPCGVAFLGEPPPPAPPPRVGAGRAESTRSPRRECGVARPAHRSLPTNPDEVARLRSRRLGPPCPHSWGRGRGWGLTMTVDPTEFQEQTGRTGHPCSRTAVTNQGASVAEVLMEIPHDDLQAKLLHIDVVPFNKEVGRTSSQSMDPTRRRKLKGQHSPGSTEGHRAKHTLSDVRGIVPASALRRTMREGLHPIEGCQPQVAAGVHPEVHGKAVRPIHRRGYFNETRDAIIGAPRQHRLGREIALVAVLPRDALDRHGPTGLEGRRRDIRRDFRGARTSQQQHDRPASRGSHHNQHYPVVCCASQRTTGAVSTARAYTQSTNARDAIDATGTGGNTVTSPLRLRKAMRG